mmetsp:Transcript_17724/g.41219  ORF Transcript_17724/g.41219 Transcript_17724/m.41219 type:complete len:165 (-) Transcript_17724:115-609(-)
MQQGPSPSTGAAGQSEEKVTSGDAAAGNGKLRSTGNDAVSTRRGPAPWRCRKHPELHPKLTGHLLMQPSRCGTAKWLQVQATKGGHLPRPKSRDSHKVQSESAGTAQGHDRHLDYPFLHAVAPPSPVFVRYMLRQDLRASQSQPSLRNTIGTSSSADENPLDEP